MADFNALQAIINAYIKRNGVQAITGQILNGVLTGMVNALGKGYTVAGAASPTTDPGTMTGPLAYIAYTAGTYTHFDNIVVEQGEVSMLIYNEAEWHKEVLFSLAAQATVDDNIGVPSVGVSFVDGILTFNFRNMKGEPGENGQDGDPAGFGTISASISGGVGTPGVSVQSSGPDTAKNIAFQFTNLKGETGVTSCVVTVDNTTGNPSCAVSLVGQELHLDFSGLKGAQGNTGSSVDYPFTIVNNLTTDDATQALSAAMGVQLESEVSQLEAEVDDLEFNIGYENTRPDEDEIIIEDANGNQVAKIDADGVDVASLTINGVSIDGAVAVAQNISEETSPSYSSEEAVIFGDEASPVFKITDEKVIVKKLENTDGYKLDFSDRELASELRDYIGSLDLSTMPIDGNVVALGDSTVSGYLNGFPVMSLLTVTGTKTDISSAGATIQDMQTAWGNLSAGAKSSANFIFVEIGLNSLASSPISDYQTLISAIRSDCPTAKVIICAMSPAHERFYDTSTPSVAEEKYSNWRFLNTAIRNGLFFGASASAWYHSIIMGDADDNLLPQYEYSTPDHIHPNADGVKVIAWSWLSAIYK